MAKPDPQGGLVIRYDYLWSSEEQEGREEGSKVRPCAIVLALAETLWSLQDVVAKIDVMAQPPKPRGSLSESGSMNIFWFIAIAQAALIIAILYTGRVRIRGRLLADRKAEPKRFLLYVSGFAASLLIVVIEAFNPPY